MGVKLRIKLGPHAQTRAHAHAMISELMTLESQIFIREQALEAQYLDL